MRTMTEDEDEPLADLRRDVEERRGNGSEEPDTDQPTVDGDDARQSRGDGSAEDGTDRGGKDEPLGDLRRSIESRAEAAAEHDDSEPFTLVDVGDVDTEALWADLLFEDEPATEEESGSTGAADEGRSQLVNKRLCHRCRYFGDPPTLACEHEGTTIHELVDMGHYRVSGCPFANTEADPFRGVDP